MQVSPTLGINHMDKKYYIDRNYVEHTCCWGTAIVCRCEEGKGMYDKGIDLILECNDDNAKFICDALNEHYNKLDGDTTPRQ